MFKISLRMRTPICFTERPTLDGIVSSCWMKENRPDLMTTQRLSIPQKELIDFRGLLPMAYEDGNSWYFLASSMCYGKMISTHSWWRKSWDSQYDYLSDFKGKRRKVAVGEGEFKSYMVPMSIFSIPLIWFYVECTEEQSQEIKRLIEGNIIGIGKKVGQGYGWFNPPLIIEEATDIDIKKMRPIPMVPGEVGNYHFCSFRPPYWHPSNMDLCSVPNEEHLK